MKQRSLSSFIIHHSAFIIPPMLPSAPLLLYFTKRMLTFFPLRTRPLDSRANLFAD